MLDKMSNINKNSDKQQLIILEPSCGHGDIIQAVLQEDILQQLQEQNGYSNIMILGLDIDPNALDICCQRLTATIQNNNNNNNNNLDYDNNSTQEKHNGQEAPPQSKQRQTFLWSGEMVMNHNDKCNDDEDSEENLTIKINIGCTNFLETQRSHYINNENDDSVVVTIGGPPYGCHHSERHLPIQFVQHCIQEWYANIITFIVPQRFPQTLPPLPSSPSSSSIDKRQQQENTNENNNNDVDQLNTNLLLSSSSLYVCECYELNSSTFYFQGITPVTQPSRIQCWYQKPPPPSSS